MLIRVGLPFLPGRHGHPFLRTLDEVGARCLISVGSLYDKQKQRFRSVPLTAWSRGPALDSAGFVATAIFGGYRWTVEECVDKIVTNFATESDAEDEPIRCTMPHPWAWWSAMDYCCEQEIAKDRAEVARRMRLTVESYVETLDFLNGWRAEGDNDTPDPLPILQGRTPADYVSMARDLGQAIDEAHGCTCPTDPENCEAEWHRTHAGLPELVGIGSVCRRPVTGPEGILSVLGALDAALPPHVKLHAFGVKGSLLRHPEMGNFAHRLESIDSAAWDMRARKDAQERRKLDPSFSCDLEHRVAHMKRWYLRQTPPIQKQRSLFASRA
jgi:hypothetical protein